MCDVFNSWYFYLPLLLHNLVHFVLVTNHLHKKFCEGNHNLWCYIMTTLMRVQQKPLYGTSQTYLRGTSQYHTMPINNKKRDSREEISINVQGTGIESLDSIKLLGVTIDNKLNFSEHINMTCKKANQRIGVLMRLKNLVPTIAKLHLFKAAILPHLTYCHLTWHFCCLSDKRKLERTLERGLRAVFRDSKSTYEELLKKANLRKKTTGYSLFDV